MIGWVSESWFALNELGTKAALEIAAVPRARNERRSIFAGDSEGWTQSDFIAVADQSFAEVR